MDMHIVLLKKQICGKEEPYHQGRGMVGISMFSGCDCWNAETGHTKDVLPVYETPRPSSH